MSEQITDELREYASTRISPNKGALEAIADRIDEAHFDAAMDARKRGVDAVLKHPESFGLIALPRDADGEYIHIGDVVELPNGHQDRHAVEYITLYSHGWSCNGFRPYAIRHYHALTVEDVMVEFATDWESAQDGEDKTAVLKEYAKRLTLAGDSE